MEQTIESKLMKQYNDLKNAYSDALLLFRTGDFYETYEHDAEVAANVLGITLTKSSKFASADGNGILLAGFPRHALDTYLPKLIRSGYRVAICEEIEVAQK